MFVSYSRKDYVDEQKNVIPGNEVSKIKEALTEAGITYWFDEEGIYSGQNFVEKIVTNIENASIFLFLSTVNANKSPWTCKEIASADEFRKHIIPVRIDSTPYNKKVLFRIADLDYIEYYTNPQKGIEDLIKSINTYLEDLANAERLKQEEENKKKEQERKREEDIRRQKEQEEKRRQEEQSRLVSEIRLTCTTLNNEETKLELDRENLLLKAEMVSDKEQRAALLDLINSGGAICKKYQEKCAELAKEINSLKSTRIKPLELELKKKEEEILQLQSDLDISKSRAKEKEESCNNLAKQIGDLQNHTKTPQERHENEPPKKRIDSSTLHIIYWCIIILCVLSFLAGIDNTEQQSKSWETRYNDTSRRLYEAENAQKTLSLLADSIPFVITDIDVTNWGEEWGAIYIAKSLLISNQE